MLCAKSSVRIFLFLAFLQFSLALQWNSVVLNDHDQMNKLPQHLLTSFWGSYGSQSQLFLFQEAENVAQTIGTPLNFETNPDQTLVVVSAQCATCAFPAVAIATKRIKHSTTIDLVPLNESEVLILKVDIYNTSKETIHNAIIELCNVGAFASCLDPHTIMDQYIWHVPQERKQMKSIDMFKRVQDISKTLLERKEIKMADPILPLLSEVSETSQRQFLDGLTSIHTRLSTAGDVTMQASYFLFGFFQGLGLDPFMFDFRPNYPPNICADITGQLEPETLVVVGAHYDDRAADITNTTARAPGANDDGSGCAVLQEIAKILVQSSYEFRYTVRMCFWAGEEQGLVGSTAYANRLRVNGTDVLGMLQGDMVGYLSPGKPFEVDMASRETDPTLTALVNQITALYVPSLAIGSTTSCCTDSASFTNAGFPAVAYNEPGGYTIDPEYHSTMDVVDRPGYDLQLIGLITQAMLAATAILAEII